MSSWLCKDYKHPIPHKEYKPQSQVGSYSCWHTSVSHEAETGVGEPLHWWYLGGFVAIPSQLGRESTWGSFCESMLGFFFTVPSNILRMPKTNTIYWPQPKNLVGFLDIPSSLRQRAFQIHSLCQCPSWQWSNCPFLAHTQSKLLNVLHMPSCWSGKNPVAMTSSNCYGSLACTSCIHNVTILLL